MKLNKYHKDYHYWISPVIILVMAIYAYKQDKHDREFAALSNSNAKVDTSIIVSKQNRMVDSLTTIDRIK
jgi:hypothetical protein